MSVHNFVNKEQMKFHFQQVMLFMPNIFLNDFSCAGALKLKDFKEERSGEE